MGGLLSYLWGGDDVAVNDATDLTRTELEAVRQVWTKVKVEAAEVGMMFFHALFESQPAYQKMFSAFPTLTKDELEKSSKFRAHCVTVMYALSAIIDHLEESDCLKEILYKVAENHRNRGTTGKHFKDFTCLVVPGLKARYGLSPAAESGWNKVISAMDHLLSEHEGNNANCM